MSRLLIVYGTREGHTRAIAARIADTARAAGHSADVVAAALHPSLAGHDAVIVAAPVHQLRHPPEVIRWVCDNLAALGRLPTAFFSVSLAAALPGHGGRRDVQANVEDFIRETGWRPGIARAVAGALAYTRYGFLARLGMRLTARHIGLDTDTSRDHAYTDWEQLRRDVELFLELFLAAAREPAPAGPTLAAR